jgi:hypothetical protein
VEDDDNKEFHHEVIISGKRVPSVTAEDAFQVVVRICPSLGFQEGSLWWLKKKVQNQ